MAAKATERPLTPKQQRFVECYVVDRNGAQAALAAGFGKERKAAAVYANRLLSKSNVKAAIASAIKKIAAKTEVDAAYVLRQAQKLHERCMQEVRPFTDRKGEQIYDDDGNPLYVFNATGAAKALELIGKHIDVQAFKDKHEISTPDGQPLIRVELVGAKK